LRSRSGAATPLARFEGDGPSAKPLESVNSFPLAVRPLFRPGIALKQTPEFGFAPPSPMTPENLLRSMCERHGLPAEYGQRLLPLVRRAMEAPDEVRDRLLALVDGNLADHAQSGPSDAEDADGAQREVEIQRDIDEDVLIAVARVLHGWSPSEPLFDFGSSVGGLETQDPDGA
jgi:hypothetical protein